MASSRVLIIVLLFIYLFNESNVDGCSLMKRLDYIFSEEWAGFYKLHDNDVTWERARQKCHREGALLAMPETIKEARILSQIIKLPQFSRGIFIGGKSVKSIRGYQTIKGVSFCRIPHEWSKNEPNSLDDSCLVLLQDGTFADEPCTESLSFVCYKKFDPECTACQNPCNTNDPGYKFEQSTGSCYKFHLITKTWADAIITCQNEGAHLVIIDSNPESAFLKKMYAEFPEAKIVGGKNMMYIGMHDIFKEGDWRNLDGKKFTNSKFVSWASGQPNNQGKNGEHCGTFSRLGFLYDEWCQNKYPFICEIESEPV